MKNWKLRRTAHGYVVVNGAGNSVSPGFARRAAAMDWLDARHRASSLPKRRACMCCGQTFGSEGIHDRMCAVCGGGARPSRASRA